MKKSNNSDCVYLVVAERCFAAALIIFSGGNGMSAPDGASLYAQNWRRLAILRVKTR